MHKIKREGSSPLLSEDRRRRETLRAAWSLGHRRAYEGF